MASPSPSVGQNRPLVKDQNGAALVEFALIAPVLIFTLLGLFEVGYDMFIQSQLQGTVQKSARTSAIENAGASQKTIDAMVEKAVKRIAPRSTVTFNRKSYATFSKIGQPEDFDDINDDGLCNDGERYEDANGNGQWDQDRGTQGFGGARDVVLYSVSVSYPRSFGVSQMLGFSNEVTFEATSVLRNQPYDEQSVVSVAAQCR